MDWDKYFSYQAYLVVSIILTILGLFNLGSGAGMEWFVINLLFIVGGGFTTKYLIKWWIDVYKNHKKKENCANTSGPDGGEKEVRVLLNRRAPVQDRLSARRTERQQVQKQVSNHGHFEKLVGFQKRQLRIGRSGQAKGMVPIRCEWG